MVEQTIREYRVWSIEYRGEASFRVAGGSLRWRVAEQVGAFPA